MIFISSRVVGMPACRIRLRQDDTWPGFDIARLMADKLGMSEFLLIQSANYKASRKTG